MGLLDGMRGLKHRLHHSVLKPAMFKYYALTEPLAQAYQLRFPYVFDAGEFPGMFVSHDEPLTRVTDEPLPRRIFTFWTGDNEMSADRRRGLEQFRAQNAGIDVLLITPDDFAEWILPEHPLHPAYEDLHLVHRSDYLRCYFLHFHGGGYADIKSARRHWGAVFDRMDAGDAWVTGYRNPLRWMGPNFPDRRIERLMRRASAQRIGQSALIARPRTPFTAEWWRQLNLLLDENADALREKPGRDLRRIDPPDYALHWNAILARIIDPLAVKHTAHIVYDSDLMYDYTKPYM